MASAPKPPAAHGPGADFTPDDLNEEIMWLSSLNEVLFRQEVGNYVRHPHPITREALRSAHLASRTFEALKVLQKLNHTQLELEKSGQKMRRLKMFEMKLATERQAVQPYATQAVLLTTTKGPVYEALLRLKAKHEGEFQELLREVKRDRKKRPKPQIRK